MSEHVHCDEDPIECSHETMVGQIEELARWVAQEREKLRVESSSPHGHAAQFSTSQAGINVLDAVASRMKVLGLWP